MTVTITSTMNAQIRNCHFERFLDEMVVYTRERGFAFPARYTDAPLKEIIRIIVAKAKKLGFDERGAIRLYMILVWNLGWDCERDPQYPWIAQTLQEMKDSSQLEQATRLYEQLKDWISKTYGEDDDDLKAAYELLLKAPLTALPVRASHFEPDMASCLSRLYPRRFEYAAPASIEALIRQAHKQAKTVFHFREVPSQSLVVLIAFLLGHTFWENPIYEAWVKPVARQKSFWQNLFFEAWASQREWDEHATAQKLAEGFRDVLQTERAAYDE